MMVSRHDAAPTGNVGVGGASGAEWALHITFYLNAERFWKERMMTEKYHQKDLRKGRVSIPGQFYSITKCYADRHPFLIPDLKDFAIAHQIFEIVTGSVAWLNEKGYFVCRNYVMMPDHLHLIFQLGKVRTLEQVMHSFASFTANEINSLLRRSGSLWQSGYYDHALRDDDAFNRHVRYIAENPVRAGFVQEPQDWPFPVIEFHG